MSSSINNTKSAKKQKSASPKQRQAHSGTDLLPRDVLSKTFRETAFKVLPLCDTKASEWMTNFVKSRRNIFRLSKDKHVASLTVSLDFSHIALAVLVDALLEKQTKPASKLSNFIPRLVRTVLAERAKVGQDAAPKPVGSEDVSA